MSTSAAVKSPPGVSLDDGALVAPAALQECPVELTIQSKLQRLPAVAGTIDVRSSGPGKGRGLFAQRGIPSGELIIDEKSFCWEVESGGDSPSVEIRVLRGATEAELDAQLLQMCPYELTAGEGSGAAQAKHVDIATLTRREAIRCAMAANSFGVREVSCGAEGPGQGDEGFAGGGISMGISMGYEGRALFSVICLTNHSCKPNCRVTQVPSSGLSPSNPPRYRMEARRDIAAGEELTVSYVPRSWRKAKRSAEITGTWGFSCDCPRCTAAYDDTVAMRCPNGTCLDEGGPFGGALHSLVYLGQDKCGKCGTKVNAGADIDIDIGDDEAVTSYLMGPLKTEGDVLATADRILKGGLAVEDARVFACANELAAQLPAFVEQVGGEDTPAGARLSSLFSEVSQAVAMASFRTPYVTAADLGIEVEVE